MAIRLPDARHLSDEVLQELRLRALRGCEMGLAQSDVAQMLGVARETVSRWWSAYTAAGLDGLPDERSGRPVGSGRFLTDEQAAHIRHLLDEYSPKQRGIARPLWSRLAVRELIVKECGITLAVRTVGEYLRRWGYTAKKPSRHAEDQDPEEVRQWLEEEYPLIEKLAEQEGAEIYWCDETGVAADRDPHYAYSHRGRRATMEVPRSHIRENVISTVNNKGEFHFKTYTGMLNATRFIIFLEQLLLETDKKIYLIADRLSAHDCDAVEQWVLARLDRIEVFFLPRRSPELNPDEYFNQDLKSNVHANGLPGNKKELHWRIEAFLRKLMELPGRVMSYFQHPGVQYAAAP